MTIDDLRTLVRHLRERLAAHAERHIDDEREAVELVGLADQVVSLTNKLAALSTPTAEQPVAPVADAALIEANELAVTIGQFQSRMMNEMDYHRELTERGRRLRVLLNAAGYPAPGSVPVKE